MLHLLLLFSLLWNYKTVHPCHSNSGRVIHGEWVITLRSVLYCLSLPCFAMWALPRAVVSILKDVIMSTAPLSLVQHVTKFYISYRELVMIAVLKPRIVNLNTDVFWIAFSSVAALQVNIAESIFKGKEGKLIQRKFVRVSICFV